MVRCKDIAEIVGVSRQAVTAVLNNSRPNCVSKEKRDEILKVAAEYNYRPNHAAVALRTGKSNMIGVVMPPWDNLYIAELCMAIQQRLTARNYTPFFTIDNNYNPVPGNLEQLLSLHVAGMITVAASLLPDDISIPVVSYFHDDIRFDSVCPDRVQDSKMIMEYLKNSGHKKIGYLGPFKDKRLKCLIEEAQKNGLEFPHRWQQDYVVPNYTKAFDHLLEENRGRDLPTALIIHNDKAALELMQYIRKCSFRIPEDFSIIGHDNMSICDYTVPSLTSISFGTCQSLADALVDLLMERIKKPDQKRKIIFLKSELVKRESVSDISQQ